MRHLSWALFVTLGACAAAPPSLTDRCLAECDRVATQPGCAPEGCRASCRDPRAASCAAELDALLDCSELASAAALCGESDRPCAAQNAAVGTCLLSAPADTGAGTDAGATGDAAR